MNFHAMSVEKNAVLFSISKTSPKENICTTVSQGKQPSLNYGWFVFQVRSMNGDKGARGFSKLMRKGSAHALIFGIFNNAKSRIGQLRSFIGALSVEPSSTTIISLTKES